MKRLHSRVHYYKEHQPFLTEFASNLHTIKFAFLRCLKMNSLTLNKCAVWNELPLSIFETSKKLKEYEFAIFWISGKIWLQVCFISKVVFLAFHKLVILSVPKQQDWDKIFRLKQMAKCALYQTLIVSFLWKVEGNMERLTIYWTQKCFLMACIKAY